jgi:peptidoglycan/xylan/chitin deacetylase (PgdA/CDA1 family)
MWCPRSLLFAALLMGCVAAASDARAQNGYFYPGYSSYNYARPYNNTYHGYWRDLGYGFSNHPYTTYGYTQRYYPAPYPYPNFGPGYPYQYGGYPYGYTRGW